MRRLALLALLVAALLLLLRARGSEGRRAAVEPPPAEAASTHAPEQRLGDGPAVAGSAADEGPAAASRQVLEPPALQGVLVRLLARESGEPVPGARVHVAKELAVLAAVEREIRMGSWLDEPVRSSAALLVERLGTRRRADEEGELLLEPAEEPLRLLAQEGELWGMATLSPGDRGPVLVRLDRSPTLRVRVLDEHGRPRGGVPVLLDAGGDPHRILSRAPDGRADFHRPLELLARSLELLPGRGSQEARLGTVRLGIAAPSTVRTNVRLDGAPQGIVDLRLPPIGELDVRLVDSAGELLALSGRAWLVWPGGDDSAVSAEIAGGRARFPHVALGQRAQLVVATDGYELALLELEGPAAHGESRLVDVRLHELAAPRAILTGSLFGPEGEPLARRSLLAVLLAEEGFVDHRELRTEADGTFRLVVEAASQELEVATHEDGRADALGARIVLPAVLRPGTNDLGRIVLRPMPLLASGKVLDRAGAPVGGVAIFLYPGQADGRRRFPHGPSTLLTRRDGAFQVHGFVASGEPLRLHALHPEHGEARLDVAPGTSGSTVVLDPPAGIAGRLLLDHGLAADELYVGFRSAMARTRSGSYRVDHDGDFLLTDVPPGTHTLFVALAEYDELLAEVEIAVPEGLSGPLRDPRLDPLDLRGTTCSVRLRVVDERGAPVPGASVARRSAGAAAYVRSERLPAGRGLLRGAGRALDLKVSAPGRGAVERLAVSGEVVVVLEPEG